MNKKQKISIKDIAQLANVSIATVSRVINHNGRYSQETKEKVEKIIKEYDYTTNMAAKSLRISKSRTIGLIVPNIDNEWFSKLVLSIENYFFNRNYSVFICNTSQDEAKEIEYFKSLDSKLVDGIICISGIETIPTNIISRNIPIVCIDRKPLNHFVYTVESDHYYGGYLATETLIKKGCQHIAIISRNKSLSVNTSRLQGYLAALKDYHLSTSSELQILIDASISNYEGARAGIKKLIDSHIPFDGLFCTNDWRAYGALSMLKEYHLKVPEDVQIIGFDDSLIAKISTPTISTIQQDIEALSNFASHLLLKLMTTNQPIAQKHYLIPVSYVERNSTKKDM